MKILAISGSPSMHHGNTDLLLKAFLKGAQSEGAETEVVYLKKQKINTCHGEFHCWFRHPGECYQKDDMNELYIKLKEADVWVFATPLFTSGVSGLMKIFMDRLIALTEPFVEKRNGITRHLLRKTVKTKKLVLISTCGFSEKKHFDPMIAHIRDFCENVNLEFAGALVRSCGPSIRYILAEKPFIATSRMEKVFQATEAAGSQIVVSGKISWWNQYNISRWVIPTFIYNKELNSRFKVILDKLTKK